MDDYDNLCHSVWDCKYHVVFIPKCRPNESTRSPRDLHHSSTPGWQAGRRERRKR